MGANCYLASELVYFTPLKRQRNIGILKIDGCYSTHSTPLKTPLSLILCQVVNHILSEVTLMNVKQLLQKSTPTL